MRNIRRQAGVWLQIITFLVIWVAILSLTQTELKIGWAALKRLPVAVTVYTALYLSFTRWGWRLPFLQGWLVPFPDLQGTWQGTFESTWQDPSTGAPPRAIPAMLVVRQSFESISCVVYTGESVSQSHAAMLSDEADTGLKRLSYNYTSRPSATIRDRSAIHDGAAILRIVTTPKRELRGEYWTNRRTTGAMTFRFRSRELLEDFPRDQA